MIRKITYILSFLVLGASSCTQSEEASPGIPVEVRFSAGIGAHIGSRASGNQWTSGDEVGIFMVRTGLPLTVGAISEGADNVRYNAVTTGAMLPSAKSVYFPAANQQVDFYAYYPFKSSLAGYIYPVNVSDQSNLPAIDLLYSRNVKGVHGGTPSVALNFSHKLCRIVMNITAGAGISSSDLEGMSVTVGGMNTTADFSLADGSLTYTGTKGSIHVPVDTKHTATAIILPTLSAPATGRSVVFSSPTINPLTWSIPNNFSFTAGNSYVYTVTISSTGVNLSLNGVDSWNNSGTETGVATPD